MKKYLLYIPFVIYLLFFIFLLILGESLGYLTFTLTLIILFLMGFCLSNKDLTAIGFACLGLFTVWYLIMGYYDYLKWTSSIIALINLVYTLVVYKLKSK